MKPTKRKRKIAASPIVAPVADDTLSHAATATAPGESIGEAVVTASVISERVIQVASSNGDARTQGEQTTVSAYSLGASCTMREGAMLKADLLKLLPIRQPVLLDVSSVERIDTSALQLLCALVRDRRAKRLTTQWVGSPSVFTEAVESLGLTQALNYTALNYTA